MWLFACHCFSSHVMRIVIMCKPQEEKRSRLWEMEVQSRCHYLYQPRCCSLSNFGDNRFMISQQQTLTWNEIEQFCIPFFLYSYRNYELAFDISIYDKGPHIYRWLSARLQHLQCVSNVDTAVMHCAIDIYKTWIKWSNSLLKHDSCFILHQLNINFVILRLVLHLRIMIYFKYCEMNNIQVSQSYTCMESMTSGKYTIQIVLSEFDKSIYS